MFEPILNLFTLILIIILLRFSLHNVRTEFKKRPYAKSISLVVAFSIIAFLAFDQYRYRNVISESLKPKVQEIEKEYQIYEPIKLDRSSTDFDSSKMIESNRLENASAKERFLDL
jgi:hypothetical protein